MPRESHEVVVIGGGPAGLSTALNLVRARRDVLVVDSNRPRHAATLVARGYLTRDGIAPLELRRIGREEVEAYDNGEVAFALAQSIEVSGAGFRVRATGVRGAADIDVVAQTVVLATGLQETLPAVPSIRAYYGTQLHSCVECDGYEKADAPLALIGETNDLAERAMLLTQWTDDLIVFTNAAGTVSDDDERVLARLGVRVERRAIDDVVGERGTMTGVRLVDGTVIERTGGFVRPLWTPSLAFVSGLDLETDDDGYLLTDAHGRSSVPGVYAVGETTPPGPQQLIVAAGSGAVAAAAINRDLIGLAIDGAPGIAVL
ncbi:pyridine nucleotide-disulfide oxidoreductase [Leifsonia sp. Root227]|uniref:NAD(P)/FAD-dependent oxidoreductase n=1 Tax=Leifsonia sp. Root227 TaxID=1736496 RepID=UPI0006FF5363|nr:NAD(P)/FAD-dependent oxidoreductase [Leifsonia sp. Root227]KRC50752.1 pyridine nucleotide-disulfide oxidoreductase [Leifsonia sp. Root227]